MRLRATWKWGRIKSPNEEFLIHSYSPADPPGSMNLLTKLRGNLHVSFVFDCFSGRLWRPDGGADSTGGKFGAPLHFLHSDYASASEATAAPSAAVCASEPPLLRFLKGQNRVGKFQASSVSSAQLVFRHHTWPAACSYLQNVTESVSQ